MEKLNIHTLNSIRNLSEIALFYRENGKYLDAKRVLINTLRYAENHHANIDELKLMILHDIGFICLILRQFDEGICHFNKAMSIGEKDIESFPYYVLVLSGLGQIYEQTSELILAKKFLEQAVKLSRDFNMELNTYVNSKFNLAQIIEKLDDPNAEEYYREVLDLALNNPDAIRRADYATMLGTYGLFLKRIGHCEKALEIFEKARTIDEQIYDANHPMIARDINNIGLVLIDLGEATKGIEYLEKAKDINKECLGDKHPEIAKNFSNIGLALNDLHEYSKAEKCFRIALEIDREFYNEKTDTIARDLQNLGSSLVILDQLEEGALCLHKAFEIDKALFPLVHVEVATDLLSLGNLYEKLKDYNKAFDTYTQCYSVFKKNYGQEHNTTIYCSIRLAGINLVQKKKKKALDSFKEILSIVKGKFGINNIRTLNVVQEIGVILLDAQYFYESLKYLMIAFKIIREISYGDDEDILQGIFIDLYHIRNDKSSQQYVEQILNILHKDGVTPTKAWLEGWP